LRGGCGGGGHGRGRGGRGHYGDDNGGRHGTPDSSERPTCQLCGKEGHTVLRCYKRFDTNFTGPADVKIAASATTSYIIDTNWYSDTGATDHITGELEKLTMNEKYHDDNHVHVADGSGMKIDQIGQSSVRTPKSNLLLNNVLYVPQANKSLISVHKLALDNYAFFEFHPHYFLVKDRTTKKVLHEGRCEGGLYPFKSESNKQAHGVAVKPSSSRWHCRLGHPSSPIVHRVISENKLPFVQESNKELVCDACQKEKTNNSHTLDPLVSQMLP
jgi:hypothetical protein